MKQNLTLEALRQLLERRDMCALRDALTQTHPADLAELLDKLDRPEMLAVFRALPKELAAEVAARIKIVQVKMREFPISNR